MKLCIECYNFLQPYIVAGTVIEYDPGSSCDVCDDVGIVRLPVLSDSVDIFHLIYGAINTWRDQAGMDSPK